MTYSCCPHSVFNVTDLSTAPVFTACNSALRFPSGRLPRCQCSSELGVLHTVCGLLMGLNQGYDLQNKESLIPSQATVFCFFVCTVCVISPQVLLVAGWYHVFRRAVCSLIHLDLSSRHAGPLSPPHCSLLQKWTNDLLVSPFVKLCCVMLRSLCIVMSYAAQSSAGDDVL